MMKRTSIGLCILALGACESTHTPPVSEPRLAEPTPTNQAARVAPAPVMVPEQDAPPTIVGTLVSKKLTTKAAPNRDNALFEAHCRVVDKVCDLASVTLTVDGQAIALAVPEAPEAAPYGDWANLGTYRSKEGLLVLSMKFASRHQHVGVVLTKGEFEIASNTVWPAELSGELIAAADWKGGAVRYRCDAFAMGWEPVDCQNLEVTVGGETLFQEDDIVAGVVEANVMPSASGDALRISTTPLDGEWEPVSTRVFAMEGGETVPVWSLISNGKHSYAADGSWKVAESECRKPAVLDYDEKLEKGVVKKFGKEAFTTKRYVWDGKSIVSKVTKRSVNRRSSCQTEGRCPHVYAGDEAVFLGEILRNRVGKDAWANEFVEVPRELVREGTLKIRLAEEKLNERTFVDGVWLMVDGVRIAPEKCFSPLCAKDGETLSMSTGDAETLTFKNIPEVGAVRFFASGYYVYVQ